MTVLIPGHYHNDSSAALHSDYYHLVIKSVDLELQTCRWIWSDSMFDSGMVDDYPYIVGLVREHGYSFTG